MPFGISTPSAGTFLVPERLTQIVVELLGDVVQLAGERLVDREFVQPFGTDLAKQCHRIAADLLPQRRIDGCEQVLRRFVPRPAQVDGQPLQRDESLGKMRADREPAEGFHATQPY